MSYEEVTAVSNKEKAEIMAKSFIKVPVAAPAKSLRGGKYLDD